MGIAVHIPLPYTRAEGLRSRKHNLRKQRRRAFLISCSGVFELINYKRLQATEELEAGGRAWLKSGIMRRNGCRAFALTMAGARTRNRRLRTIK